MKIEIVHYNSEWPVMYEEVKNQFFHSFGEKIAQIEHIGSTSVKGLGAKPIIDVLLGVKKLSDAEDIIPNMEHLGYEYVFKYEDIMPERRYFVKSQNGKSIHHIHTVEITSEFWKRHLLFRDFLMLHDNLRDKYFRLKKKLAAIDWEDKMGYTDAKTDFIRKIEKEAESYFKK
ncbi:MAG: GrpB family protein [Ignavibacteria bacterium]